MSQDENTRLETQTTYTDANQIGNQNNQDFSVHLSEEELHTLHPALRAASLPGAPFTAEGYPQDDGYILFFAPPMLLHSDKQQHAVRVWVSRNMPFMIGDHPVNAEEHHRAIRARGDSVVEAYARFSSFIQWWNGSPTGASSQLVDTWGRAYEEWDHNLAPSVARQQEPEHEEARPAGSSKSSIPKDRWKYANNARGDILWINSRTITHNNNGLGEYREMRELIGADLCALEMRATNMMCRPKKKKELDALMNSENPADRNVIGLLEQRLVSSDCGGKFYPASDSRHCPQKHYSFDLRIDNLPARLQWAIANNEEATRQYDAVREALLFRGHVFQWERWSSTPFGPDQTWVDGHGGRGEEMPTFEESNIWKAFGPGSASWKARHPNSGEFGKSTKHDSEERSASDQQELKEFDEAR